MAAAVSLGDENPKGVIFENPIYEYTSNSWSGLQMKFQIIRENE